MAYHPRTRRISLGLALATVLLVLPGARATSTPPPEEPPTSRAARTWQTPLVGGPKALDVSRSFDPPAQPWLAGHRGVDLTAAPGSAVLSPAPGVVSFAGRVAGRGVVVVTHDDGLRSSFEPVTDAPTRGTVVATGTTVGVVEGISVPPHSADDPGVASHGGHCAASCLHWGVRRGETYLDPLSLLGDRPPIVLLPLG